MDHRFELLRTEKIKTQRRPFFANVLSQCVQGPLYYLLIFILTKVREILEFNLDLDDIFRGTHFRVHYLFIFKEINSKYN